MARRAWCHYLSSASVLVLDLVAGEFLLFPILFVPCVVLAAWYTRPSVAYTLSVLLPSARMAIIDFHGAHPIAFSAANGVARMLVLAFLAFFTGLVAEKNRILNRRLKSLVTICAWSKTVEYEGEWISFEQYLLRRFGQSATHGISPAEASKFTADSDTETLKSGKPSGNREAASKHGDPPSSGPDKD